MVRLDPRVTEPVEVRLRVKSLRVPATRSVPNAPVPVIVRFEDEVAPILFELETSEPDRVKVLFPMLRFPDCSVSRPPIVTPEARETPDALLIVVATAEPLGCSDPMNCPPPVL